MLTDFIAYVHPSPSPADVKKIVELNDATIVIMYVICYLTPPSLVCKSSGERGLLDLYTRSAFPYDTVLGFRAGLMERFDHSRG